MKTFQRCCWLGSLAFAAQAASTDLAPPSLTSFMSPSISGGAIGDDRGVLIQSMANLAFAGAGIFFDPLAGGASGIRLSVFSVTGVAGNYNLGPELYTGTAGVNDTGAGFYNVALNFGMVTGGLYYIAFSSLDGAWGDGLNQMEFYNFDQKLDSAPYVAGGVKVLDGGAFPSASVYGFANAVLPHITLYGTAPPSTSGPTGGGSTGGGSTGGGSTGGGTTGGGSTGGGTTGGGTPGGLSSTNASTTTVPEPGSWLLMAGAAALYFAKRTRSTAATLASSSLLRRSV